jgi:hypothetical protein
LGLIVPHFVIHLVTQHLLIAPHQSAFALGQIDGFSAAYTQKQWDEFNLGHAAIAVRNRSVEATSTTAK